MKTSWSYLRLVNMFWMWMWSLSSWEVQYFLGQNAPTQHNFFKTNSTQDATFQIIQPLNKSTHFKISLQQTWSRVWSAASGVLEMKHIKYLNCLGVCRVLCLTACWKYDEAKRNIKNNKRSLTDKQTAWFASDALLQWQLHWCNCWKMKLSGGRWGKTLKGPSSLSLWC